MRRTCEHKGKEREESRYAGRDQLRCKLCPNKCQFKWKIGGRRQPEKEEDFILTKGAVLQKDGTGLSCAAKHSALGGRNFSSENRPHSEKPATLTEAGVGGK